MADGYRPPGPDPPPEPTPVGRVLSPGGGSMEWHKGHVDLVRISEIIIECLQVLQRMLLPSFMIRPEATQTCQGERGQA